MYNYIHHYNISDTIYRIYVVKHFFIFYYDYYCYFLIFFYQN